jgi:hypothetical protein
MNKMRFVTKVVVGGLAASALLVGTLSAPAQAARDTGWDSTGSGKTSVSLVDTGWD